MGQQKTKEDLAQASLNEERKARATELFGALSRMGDAYPETSLNTVNSVKIYATEFFQYVFIQCHCNKSISNPPTSFRAFDPMYHVHAMVTGSERAFANDARYTPVRGSAALLNVELQTLIVTSLAESVLNALRKGEKLVEGDIVRRNMVTTRLEFLPALMRTELYTHFRAQLLEAIGPLDRILRADQLNGDFTIEELALSRHVLILCDGVRAFAHSFEEMWVADEIVICLAARGSLPMNWQPLNHNMHGYRPLLTWLAERPAATLPTLFKDHGLGIIGAHDLLWAVIHTPQVSNGALQSLWPPAVLEVVGVLAKLISVIPPALYGKPPPIATRAALSPRFTSAAQDAVGVSTVMQLMDWAASVRSAKPKRYAKAKMARILRCARHQQLLEIVLLHQRLMCITGLCRDVVAVIVSFALGGHIPSPPRFFSKLKLSSASST